MAGRAAWSGAGCASSRCTTSTWPPATGPADWPDAFAQRLLREIVPVSRRATDAAALVLRPTAASMRWSIGERADAPIVAGPARDLAAWLIGRADGAGSAVTPDGPLPTPPEWI